MVKPFADAEALILSGLSSSGKTNVVLRVVPLVSNIRFNSLSSAFKMKKTCNGSGKASTCFSQLTRFCSGTDPYRVS